MERNAFSFVVTIIASAESPGSDSVSVCLSLLGTDYWRQTEKSVG